MRMTAMVFQGWRDLFLDRWFGFASHLDKAFGFASQGDLGFCGLSGSYRFLWPDGHLFLI